MSNVISITRHDKEEDRLRSDDVAQCLREWLERAEAGEIVAIAIAAEREDYATTWDYTKSAETVMMLGALSMLKDEITETLQ